MRIVVNGVSGINWIEKCSMSLMVVRDGLEVLFILDLRSSCW